MRKTIITIENALAKIIMVVCMLFFCNIDVYSITTWGIGLLECISNGKFRSYAILLEQAGHTTNYSILTNFITAIWLSPLYILQEILGTTFNMYLYMSWYKIFVCIVAFLLIRVFGCILKNYILFEEYEELSFSKLFFIFSPTFILAIVAGGQVDGLGTLFLLLAFEAMLQQKDKKMILFSVLAICVKGLAVLFVLPWIILMWQKGKEKRTLKIGILVFAGVIAQYLLSDLLFVDYNACISRFNINTNNIAGRIYINNIGDVNLFLLTVIIVCVFCYVLAKYDKVKRYHYYLMPVMIMVSMVAFVDWNPQYLIYMMPFVVAMIAQVKNKDEFLLCNLIFNVGYVISVPISDPAYYDSSGMLNNTIVRAFVGRDYTGPFLEDFLVKIYPNMLSLGVTMMVVSLICILWLYYMHTTGRLEGEKGNDIALVKDILMILQIIPVLVFIVSCFYLYFTYL